ncbi:MAG: hypothetical protein VXY43_02590 [Pseudomonadota bacterium]|nr:hypothetical protein [Pseudomonadota bacterium]
MAKKCLFNLVFGWILVFGWLAGAGLSPALARDAYLSLAPDIPLAPGLSEFDGGQVVFDKPEGRIVRIEAERLETQGAGDGVPAFYRETLPNLGWQLNGAYNSADNVLTFQRGGETLLITMQGERVVFKLSPFAESD